MRKIKKIQCDLIKGEEKSGGAEEEKVWGSWESGRAGARHWGLLCGGIQSQRDWSLAETHPKTAITSNS